MSFRSIDLVLAIKRVLDIECGFTYDKQLSISISFTIYDRWTVSEDP